MRKLTIAVDFDGVLNAYTGWEDGEVKTAPLPGAIPGLKLLMELFCVFVLTTRDPVMVEDWFRKYAPEIMTLVEQTSVQIDGDYGQEMIWPDNFDRVFWNDDEAQGRVLITRRKLPAVAYLDDRAIRFTSWPNALLDIDREVKAEFGAHSATPYHRP